MEKLIELLKKHEDNFPFLKDEKTVETIAAIKETFIDKFLERGDLRVLVLDSIAKKPKHGYQIITSISRRFYEVYKPSPGVIYPTLQSLSDEGLVDYEQRGKKKVYSITKKGEKELKKNKKRLSDIIKTFKEAYNGIDGGHNQIMERVTPLWVELAYNVFFRTRMETREGKDPAKKLKEMENILKRAVKESEEVWK
jgi:DNA-binding PadR family transcriptional regulator